MKPLAKRRRFRRSIVAGVEVGRGCWAYRVWRSCVGIILLAHVAVAHAATGAAEAPISGNAPATADTPALAVRRVYRQAPKRPLEVEIRFPSGWNAAQRRPAIVFWYGGGFWTRNVDQFARQAQYFAQRGMVTILADYETGEADGTKPPAAFADARAAMRWIRAHAAELGLDPGRIAAAGGSAGGSMAAALVIKDGVEWPGADTNTPVRPNALLLYNPALGVQLSDRTIQRFGDEATWRKTAAALHVTADTPAALLLFGSKDPLLVSGRVYAEKLKGVGVRAEIRVTDGVGHGFFNEASQLAATTKAVDEFLQSLGWLGKEPSVPLPKGDAVLQPSEGNPERPKAR